MKKKGNNSKENENCLVYKGNGDRLRGGGGVGRGFSWEV